MNAFYCPCGQPESKHPETATVGWWVEHVEDADFDLSAIVGPHYERLVTPAERILYGIEPGTVINLTINDFMKEGE